MKKNLLKFAFPRRTPVGQKPFPAYEMDREHPRLLWEGPSYQVNTKQEKAALQACADSQLGTYDQLLKQYPELLGNRARAAAMLREMTADQNPPIRVAVTGASGQIGYALVYRIASGDLFGPRTPVILQLLELPQAMNALEGVEMELRDCAFPSLVDIVCTDKPEQAFKDADYALLVGSQPRTAGMERGDLLKKNAEIFSVQGKALNTAGKGKDTYVAVVGNPANTNAMIAAANAPKIPKENFCAMTRLDHNRGLSQIAEKTGCQVDDIKQFAIWGNHSATQFPDISYATINGQPAREVINDDDWVEKEFTPAVQVRGATIIKVRGKSSAASAASALVDNVRDWHYGTFGEWTSMGVSSKGEYGVDEGLFFSYPVTCGLNSFEVVPGLPISEAAQVKIDATHKELKSERDAIASLLPRS